MAPSPIHGSDIAQLILNSLAGMQNLVDQQLLYSALNEGKNEVWMILKELKANYFVVSSQGTDSSADFYFPQLSTTSRQYTLPSDYHEMRLIEVEDVGYEDTHFQFQGFSTIKFQDARRANTNEQAEGGNTLRSAYYWDVVGKDQFVLAQFPEIAFHLTIWYVRIIDDVSANDTLDEVLYPYVQKIAEYATQKLMLSLQEQQLSQEWKEQFRASVVRLSESAGTRQSADPEFVTDFTGYFIED